MGRLAVDGATHEQLIILRLHKKLPYTNFTTVKSRRLVFSILKSHGSWESSLTLATFGAAWCCAEIAVAWAVFVGERFGADVALLLIIALTVRHDVVEVVVH